MTGLARWGLLAVLPGLLVADGAAWSGSFARGETEAAMLLLYPERLIGMELTLSLVDVVAVEADGYRVREGEWGGRVLGDPAGLRVGEELYVRGRFLEPGVLQETWRIEAPQRGGKKLLGLLAMALVAGIAAVGVRPGSRGLTLRTFGSRNEGGSGPTRRRERL